jgi:hypothetical protein
MTERSSPCTSSFEAHPSRFAARNPDSPHTSLAVTATGVCPPALGQAAFGRVSPLSLPHDIRDFARVRKEGFAAHSPAPG